MKRTILLLAIFSGSTLPNISKAQLFTKITDPQNPVVTYTTAGNYKGAAWVDFDNDGDIDLSASPDRLFRNDGAGKFTELQSPVGKGQTQTASGLAWADVDNDGDLDILLACNPSRIYLNDGQANFTEFKNGPFGSLTYGGWAPTFGDVDNNGYVDFVIAHPAGFIGTKKPCVFFKNKGNLDFEQIKGYTFTDSLAPYTVPYFIDFDEDGDLDLFIASGPGGSAGRDYIYINQLKQNGKDTLIRDTLLPFSRETQDGQCYNFVDMDLDGDLDLYLTNWQGAPSRLYKLMGGTYVPETNAMTAKTSSLSNAWGDFDNDGDLDVIVTNDASAKNKYFENNGDGTFTSINNAAAVSGCSGATIGDYDNDGDLDLYLHGVALGKGLFRNDLSNNNSWIQLSCVGIQSNKAAIGTKVQALVTIQGKKVWLKREISAQNTFNGHNDLRVHFGVGQNTSIDSLILIWPSGIIDRNANIVSKKFYKAVEGQQLIALNTSANSLSGKAIQYFKISPNPALQNTISIEVNADPNNKIEVKVYDLNAKLVKQLQLYENLSIVDLTGLPAATYMLQLSLNSYVEHYKIVKK